MRRIAACLCVALSLAISAAAPAQQGRRPAKETLVFRIPPGFKLAFQNHRPDQSIFEFIPEGQTVENWDEMVTYMVLPGGQSREPREFNETMRQLWHRQCGKLSGPPIDQKEQKGYAVSILLIDCEHFDRTKASKGIVVRDREILLSKAVRGRDALHILQRAWHGDMGAETPLDRRGQALLDWTATISSSEICDGRIPDMPCRLLEPKPPAN